MRTLNTWRKYRGYSVQVDYTRAGTYECIVTASTNNNEGAEELMHLLGFKQTTTRADRVYYRREFPNSLGAKTFLIGQRRWRVV